MTRVIYSALIVFGTIIIYRLGHSFGRKQEREAMFRQHAYHLLRLAGSSITARYNEDNLLMTAENYKSEYEYVQFTGIEREAINAEIDEMVRYRISRHVSERIEYLDSE